MQLLSLAEIEQSVPGNVLLQCVSCVLVHQPKLHKLASTYNGVKWVVMKREYDVFALVRSLVISLESLSAKRAAVEWGELQLQNAPSDPSRLIRLWKTTIKSESLKAVRERRKCEREMRSVRQQVQGERRIQRQTFETGVKFERQLMSKIEEGLIINSKEEKRRAMPSTVFLPMREVNHTRRISEHSFTPHRQVYPGLLLPETLKEDAEIEEDIEEDDIYEDDWDL